MTHRLPPAESLTVEFKSDRKRLPDNELIDAVVCLANAEGGELWLGVEDDVRPAGLHVDHQALTGLAGLIAARTSPSVAVAIQAVDCDGVQLSRWIRPASSSAVTRLSSRMRPVPSARWRR